METKLMQGAVLLLQISQDPILDKVWGAIIVAVVAQLVVGLLFTIGFVSVVRKAVDKDIPAKLQSIDQHLEAIGKELISMRREMDGHGYRIQALERHRDDLDDTRSRMRPQPPRR